MPAQASQAAPELRIGTAGWSVPSRYAAQVPTGGSHLERYARVLNCAEINSSFYRPHQRKTYERWAQSTPDDFRFAVKVPKAMTHERRLTDCAALLDVFAQEVSGLGGKLGALLVQLPPKAEFGAAAAGAFFTELQERFDAPVVFEPRHASWFTPQVDEWLRERGVARVAADPAKIEGADVPGGWSGLAYYRWHGSPRMYFSNYEADALASLRSSMEADRTRGIPVWCIFDNTGGGAALGNALELAAMLNASAASSRTSRGRTS